MLLSYLQDPLNTEPKYLVIVLFSTEKLYTNMAVRYAVHVPLGRTYFVFVACLALNPCFLIFVRYCSVTTQKQVVIFFDEE